MNFLGRLFVKSSNQTDRFIEHFLFENNAAWDDDDYNRESHSDTDGILDIDATPDLNFFAENFTPETIEAIGKEQMLEVTYTDAGVAIDNYEVVLVLELEEVYLIEQFQDEDFKEPEIEVSR